MTNAQKELLRKHAEHFEAMATHVHQASPEALEELMEACLAVSQTNCGWSVYQAAQYLKSEVQIKMNVNARAASQLNAV